MDEATAKALIAKSRELVAELEAERARLRFISKCLMIIAAFCCALAAYNLYHSL